MKTKNDEYIYVILVKALTGLGKFARCFSKYDYTHIAVCLDDKFEDFITFSRRKHFAPFDCGFMHETLDCYAFGKNEKVKLKIFKVPVSEADKSSIEKFIENISNDESYLFNFLSMVTMMIIHGFRIYKSYNCMSFVGKIIELSNSVKMEKPYYKYNIKEIDSLLGCYLYKEEYFKKVKTETQNYMDKVSVFKNLNLFFKLNGKLIYRLIARRKDFYE